MSVRDLASFWGWRKRLMCLCRPDGTWWHYLVMGSVEPGVFSYSFFNVEQRQGLPVRCSRASRRTVLLPQSTAASATVRLRRRNHPALHWLLTLPPNTCWQVHGPSRIPLLGLPGLENTRYHVLGALGTVNKQPEVTSPLLIPALFSRPPASC